MVFRIRSRLKKNGILYISVPSPHQVETPPATDPRYMQFRDPLEYKLIFRRLGFTFTAESLDDDSIGRPDRKWITLVFRYSDSGKLLPLDQIESIINKDKKNTTYKLALLRSLADIAGNYYNSVKIIHDYSENISFAAIPVDLITEKWIRYYWPFMTSDHDSDIWIRMGINQKNEKSVKSDMAFRRSLTKVKNYYNSGRGKYPAYLRDSIEVRNSSAVSPDIKKLLLQLKKEVSKALINGPVQYITNQNEDQLFRVYQINNNVPFLRIPAGIWEEFAAMSHWIRDSLLLRWAEMIIEFNKKAVSPGKIYEILYEDLMPERDTAAVRSFFEKYIQDGFALHCVWSGKKISGDFSVDHAIPFSLWRNNDIWNLLPADTGVNLKKSDKLPEYSFLAKKKDSIISVWEILNDHFPGRFLEEAGNLAGRDLTIQNNNWQNILFGVFTEAIESTASLRKTDRWSL